MVVHMCDLSPQEVEAGLWGIGGLWGLATEQVARPSWATISLVKLKATVSLVKLKPELGFEL